MKSPTVFKRILLGGLAAVCVLTACDANATADCKAAATVVLNPAPLNIPANPSVGQVLGDPNGYAFEIPNALVCTYNPTFVEYWSYMKMPADTDFSGQSVFYQGVSMPVYRTGVMGVGFGMMAQDRDGGAFSAVTTGTTTLRGPVYPGIPSWGYRGRLFFFATGRVLGGVMPSRTVGVFSLNAPSAGFQFVQLGNTLVGPPRPPTCSVTTPSIPLNLGAVAAKDFKGVGSVAGAATRTLELDCAGGTGARVEVWVTLTDQVNPANRTDRLSLTAASSARGVAVQLLHGNTLIRYGPDSAAIGNPNQWLAASTDNGPVQIPLTARYIQTEPLIQPGTANGLATFTMSYR
ncbi:fimbrial protein [Pseudomonas sp. SDO528_S397]